MRYGEDKLGDRPKKKNKKIWQHMFTKCSQKQFESVARESFVGSEIQVRQTNLVQFLE